MKSLYMISCCLFTAAIAGDLVGKHYFGHAAATLAAMGESAEREKVPLEEESRAALQSGDFLTLAGTASAGLAVLCWIGSIVQDRQENRKVRWAVALTLLVGYVLLFFIAV